MRLLVPGTNGGLDRSRFGRFPYPVRPRRLVRQISAPALALLLAASILPAAGLVADGPQARAATEIRPRITGIKPLSHEVYGYLPYWRLDSGTVNRLHYELVSSIAFFGLGIKSTGDLDTDWVGYKEYVGEDAAAVTNAAHDRGVRVVPTFQLFDSKAGYPKMTKFLTSVAAQDRFIAQALDLMEARKADGAGLDFEPVGGLNPLGKYYVPFVQRFRTAMKARFPTATLVNALSAGGSERIIKGLVGVVDHEMVMTYNYRWSGSTITGAIAPLDHATRNVKIHIARVLQWAPAKSVLLGVPYYGYNWPVTSKVPNADVRLPRSKYGGVSSVTYASARDWLKAHPKTVRHYDALEGSSYYTYKSTKYNTYRQVYFDDERSLAAKYDYAIVTGLGGVGIWTLENDKGYENLWNVLRNKFYAPVRAIRVTGRALEVTKAAGVVFAKIRITAREIGTVPERGSWRWTIRDAAGDLVRWGTLKKQTIYPNRLATHTFRVRLGSTAGLKAGTYTIRVRVITSAHTWRSAVVNFRQPY
jgi:chitinase